MGVHIMQVHVQDFAMLPIMMSTVSYDPDPLSTLLQCDCSATSTAVKRPVAADLTLSHN